MGWVGGWGGWEMAGSIVDPAQNLGLLGALFLPPGPPTLAEHGRPWQAFWLAVGEDMAVRMRLCPRGRGCRRVVKGSIQKVASWFKRSIKGCPKLI